MRSETAEIAIELSMQPWNAFRPDGVIMFSDILTPLPAMGIEFDVVRGKGPIIQEPIRRCRVNDLCVFPMRAVAIEQSSTPWAGKQTFTALSGLHATAVYQNLAKHTQGG